MWFVIGQRYAVVTLRSQVTCQIRKPVTLTTLSAKSSANISILTPPCLTHHLLLAKRDEKQTERIHLCSSFVFATEDRYPIYIGCLYHNA